MAIAMVVQLAVILVASELVAEYEFRITHTFDTYRGVWVERW